jgi:pimeloyl-ACP methyl ester carboxylesterase
MVEADDRPVAVILHGFGSSTTGWHFEPLKLWLTDPAVDRYGLVLCFECDSLQRRLPDLADDLRDQLDRVGLLQGRRRLDIFAHSMGGILARWLIENPEAASSDAQSTVRRSIRRLVMAGPPNLGARLAELGDALIRLLQTQRRFSQADVAAAPASLRLPLISALARRSSLASPAARPLVQSLNDLMPGSDVLTALQASARLLPDSPAYYLIQGLYDPIPAGEPHTVRLLRQAMALLDDMEPRWSDLIVAARSQAGCAPFLRGPAVAWPPQHTVLPQTWHHQYWQEHGTFAAIRQKLLGALPH